MTDRLAYRVPEVCAMLGISRATLYRRVKMGEIALHRLGGVALIKRESLEALLRAVPTSLPTSAFETVSDKRTRADAASNIRPLKPFKK